MAGLITKNRKSNVLTPSQLRCLSKIPTINITAGCIHNCIYCYAKGYSQYPGDGKVILFDNTANKLKQELVRKRKKPQAVYFCPSCDLFQPISEILAQTYETITILLEAGVGVQFVTKAVVPPDFIKLFTRFRGLVCCQIGLSCADDNIRKIFEPATASVSEKLATIKNLIEAGVTVGTRADPLVYGVTDSDGMLNDLFSATAGAGVKEVAVNYLFLRPAIRESIRVNIKDKALLAKVLGPYSEGCVLPIGLKNSQGLALPKEIREKAYERIKTIALSFGVSIHICGCQNPDITAELCNITRVSNPVQLTLFESSSG
ncbi:MAG: radical SAM protein [Sedimentisphaerales bacterium]|jgi:DNA repair photolyase